MFPPFIRYSFFCKTPLHPDLGSSFGKRANVGMGAAPVSHLLWYYIPSEFPSPQSNVVLCFKRVYSSQCGSERKRERPLLLILSKSVHSDQSHITYTLRNLSDASLAEINDVMFVVVLCLINCHFEPRTSISGSQKYAYRFQVTYLQQPVFSKQVSCVVPGCLGSPTKM